jgi:ankyrin repeat protein
MKKIQLLILSLALCTVGFANAQKTNEFLSRAYWKTNPTIMDIDKQIADGNDITELDSNMFDAVSIALIEKVDNQTIKYLLSKKGNNVNKLTHDGRTYIFWAAYKDNLEMMEFLVKKGAKIDIIDSHGYSVMNFAAVTGQLNTKLYDFCITHGKNVLKETNDNGANALLLVAPFAEDFTIIEYFVSKGISLKSTDTRGNGIFNYTAKSGNIPLLKLLVDKGVDYKTLSKKGENAIIFASRGLRKKVNTLEAFKYFVSLDIVSNITTNSGETPLHSLAYKSEDIAVFKYFIAQGVALNQADDKGNTGFINASSQNTKEVVQYLSQYVKEINHKNKDGKTALTYAVHKNSPEVVAFLLEKGAEVNVLDKEKNNLTYYLLRNFNSEKPLRFNEKLALLQKKGFDVLKPQSNGNTLFHLALDTNNLSLVKYANSLGVNVNQKNKEGISPLHVAAMKAKNTEILKYLISIGADKSQKTDFEESVYNLAQENEILQREKININFLK